MVTRASVSQENGAEVSKVSRLAGRKLARQLFMDSASRLLASKTLYSKIENSTDARTSLSRRTKLRVSVSSVQLAVSLLTVSTQLDRSCGFSVES